MVRLDDRYSPAKGLAPLMANLALVEGVGVATPELSHTEMMTRWWQGDPTGNGSVPTGFLGRCCDLMGNSPASAQYRSAAVPAPLSSATGRQRCRFPTWDRYVNVRRTKTTE